MSRRVVVVGGGNAALCAAIAARQGGAAVVVLERAPQSLRGGNTAFTAGGMRVSYSSVDEIKSLVPDLSPEQLALTDFGAYSESAFYDDLARVTQYRANPDLAEQLVTQSLPTLQWMREQGVRFVPIYGRQAFKVGGRYKFWGGMTIEVVGGGPGIIDFLTRAAEREGAEIRYGARAIGLAMKAGAVRGVHVREDKTETLIECDAVVLASGGFQANAEWRAR